MSPVKSRAKSRTRPTNAPGKLLTRTERPSREGTEASPSLAAVFRALGDETRLTMLERLASADSSLCVCDLEYYFDLSQPTVSHHLKVLRDAGLVTCERRGTWIHCAVDREAVARLVEFAAQLGSGASSYAPKKGSRS